MRRVILLDAQGNTNRFTFVHPVINKKIPPGEFKFTPPPGTRIIKELFRGCSAGGESLRWFSPGWPGRNERQAW